MADDLRFLAEERARRLSTIQQVKPLSSSKKKSPSHRQHRLALISDAKNEMHLQNINENSDNNPTTIDAKIAAIDFKINGTRARVLSSEFCRPRWEPDSESCNCHSCSKLFDWITRRRHHCRHCGKLYCHDCSNNFLLLPQQFGERNPQRVCKLCTNLLLPSQDTLSMNIANHMRSNLINTASGNFRRYLNLPLTCTMGSAIRNAAYSSHNLLSAGLLHDQQIPIKLISEAKGLVFVTVMKGGLFIAPQIGNGLIISKLDNGKWSAPSAIALYGISYGFCIGADVADYIICLNSDEAISAFSGNMTCLIDAEIELSGLFGRSLKYGFSLGDCSSVISYSHTKGLFASISAAGAVLVARPHVNHLFYGKEVSVQSILEGKVEQPKASESLYDALRELLIYDAIHI